MPWRKRGRTIPASCADLDLEAAGRELIRASGNVSAAARALGVPVRDLRLLTFTVPELIDAALEAEERVQAARSRRITTMPPTIDLTDSESAAVTAAIRRAIDDDRFPRVQRLDSLRSALAKLDPATAQS
jgi:hypothetical protein